MKVDMLFFAAERYWEKELLGNTYRELENQFGHKVNCILVQREEDLKQIKTGASTAVLAPLSGAVQSLVLQAAKEYQNVVMYAAYVEGNLSNDIRDNMLYRNAAPTVMECWSILRRKHKQAKIALSQKEWERSAYLFSVKKKITSSKILLVGETEPWVLSSSRNLSQYQEILGVEIQQISQEEIAATYKTITVEEAKPYYDYFVGKEQSIEEPTDDDLINASRLAAALEQTLEKYNADGMALACFNLLAVGTSSCLGVSYMNDNTEKFISCEGDIDSACTMLLMKQITKQKLWMANPALCEDECILYSHCTAPIHTESEKECPYILRNHHESGIGVSIQVEFPLNKTVTMCRFLAEDNCMTIQKGITLEYEYQPCCRTQSKVKPDNFEVYLNTVLGCHQVLCFSDIAEDMKELAKLLGIAVL